MSAPEKQSNTTTSRIAWVTGIACAACCAIPLFGVLAGSATLAGLAIYSERMAALVAVVGVAVFTYKKLTQKAGPACELTGNCAPAKESSDAKQ